MMGIRIACFILMVVITPYGWYTWVFGAAAIVLPYIAVVMANAVGPRSGQSVAPVDHTAPAALPEARAEHEDRTIHGRVVDS